MTSRIRVTNVRFTPVAVADPPLLNSIGVHQPYALRTIIEVLTDEGLIGLSETYGRPSVWRNLRAVAPSLGGLDPFDTNGLWRAVDSIDLAHAGVSLPLAPGTTPARERDTLLAALEVAFLDLQGKTVGRSVSDLLGGAAVDRVPFAAYLFFKFAEHRFDTVPPDPYGEALDPDGIVAQARRMTGLYGFRSLKLKGGVRPPDEEAETIRALRRVFPDHPTRLDPNAAWTGPTSIAVARALDGQLEYLEDPTPGIEGMAAVAREAPMPLATNMVVTSFADLERNSRLDACRVILADHHYFGGLERSRQLATVCNAWGLGLSMHSNTHLGISLAAMVHAAAVMGPALSSACDTHYPWNSEEVIVGGKIPIVDGSVAVPSGPGLGVELDHDALDALHDQYRRCGIAERDDASEMRKYDSEWTGDLPRF